MPDEPTSGAVSAAAGTQSEQLQAPFRLRDLDRRGKIWAAVLALGLLLAPIQAFVHSLPDWAPTNDPAYMGIQSLEVGTRDTPLTGQPSTSALYVESDRHVDHLGPLQFYMMALPMRLLGLTEGMLSVSLVIVSTCILLMAWAAYRRLGPPGGVLGVAVIGLITFTTGAAGLMNPVSSNMAGYPLYCSALLIWCVMRGDIRLLPLATGMTAFAAQQHLSVLPTVAVLALAGIAGLLYQWGRDGRWRDSQARRQLLAWSGASALVGLVLWSPMLLQQVTGDPGNLSHLVRLSLDDERPTLGLGSSVRQVAHVLGLPTLLGKLDLTGAELVASVSPLTWVSAGAVLLMLVGLGLHWRRAPERLSVVSMSAVLVVAGLVNGSSVLDSIEQVRLALYHWVFPLAFFVTVAMALGAIEGVRKAAGRLSSGRLEWTWKQPRFVRPTLAGGTLLVIGLPALVNPTLERPSNELAAFSGTVERPYVEDLVDQVMAHRDRFDEPVVLMQRGFRGFSSLRESLALHLLDDGVDVRFPLDARHYVADRRLVDSGHETGGLLLVHDTNPDWTEVDVGELIADVLTVQDLESETFDRALELIRSTDQLRFSSSLRQYFEDFPDEWLDAAERGELQAELEGRDAAEFGLADPTEDQIARFWSLTGLDQLHWDPEHYLADPLLLDMLLEHPLQEPELDAGVLREIRESELGSLSPDRPLRLRVYLLDHDELAEIAADDLPSQPSTGDS